MNRRNWLVTTLKGLLGAVLLGTTSLIQGCTITLADVLKEIGNVLTFIAPLIGGVLPIVEIADPALIPGVTAANAIFQAGVTAVNGFLQQWANASAAAQPGFLPQLEAAAQALVSDLSNLLAAAHVSDVSTAGEITAIIAAASQEVAALITFIGQLKAAGGTTAALKSVHVSVTYSGSLDPVAAARNRIVSHLRKTIGKVGVDDARKQLAAKLAGLKIERTRAGSNDIGFIPVP